MKKKMFSILVCLALFILPLNLSVSGIPAQSGEFQKPERLGIDEETSDEYTADYTLAAQNDNLLFYADMEKGWFALQNRRSGKIWYSNPNDAVLDDVTTGISRTDIFSDYIFEYYDNSTVGEASALTFNSHTTAVRQKNVSVEKVASGIKVTYRFDTFGFTVPVIYSLLENSLEVKVCVDEIEESGNYSILSIRVLPNFGAANSDTDGWMLIPDGSGAIASFGNGRYNIDGYEALVYGREYAEEKTKISAADNQNIRLPVFGITEGSNALFAAITEGEASAAVRAEFSSDSFGYNNISSKLILRTVSTIEVNAQNATRLSDCDFSGDYTVRYWCLDGDNASYSGMAVAYRDYLIEEKGMKKTELSPALNLNIYGAIDVKANFLGIPYKKLKSLTSFSEAAEMAAYLLENGVGGLSVRYEGWTNNGFFNKKIPKNAKPLSVLGGKKDFKALNDYLTEIDAQFYPDADFLRFTSSGNGVSKNKDSVKNTFGEIVEQYDYMLSVDVEKIDGNNYYLLSADKVGTVINNFLKKYSALKASGISLGTMGSYVYADLNTEDGFNRTALVSSFENVFKALGNYSIAVEGGNMVSAVYADKVFDAPLSSSGNNLFEKDVPFYQIVFHGYTVLTTSPLNKTADDRLLFLNAVETGTELLFDGIYGDASALNETPYNSLYSTTFDLWKTKAADYDKEYRPLLEKIYDKAIIRHTEVSDGVYETVYEDGTAVYVNYNASEQTVSGIKIGGMDFETVSR